MARLLSGEARGATWFAAVLTTITVLAAADMALGNPTAINAVIGCGVCAVLATAVAVSFHRQDRRHHARRRRP